jgi:hypothetical protein
MPGAPLRGACPPEQPQRAGRHSQCHEGLSREEEGDGEGRERGVGVNAESWRQQQRRSQNHKGIFPSNTPPHAHICTLFSPIHSPNPVPPRPKPRPKPPPKPSPLSLVDSAQAISSAAWACLSSWSTFPAASTAAASAEEARRQARRGGAEQGRVGEAGSELLTMTEPSWCSRPEGKTRRGKRRFWGGRGEERGSEGHLQAFCFLSPPLSPFFLSLSLSHTQIDYIGLPRCYEQDTHTHTQSHPFSHSHSLSLILPPPHSRSILLLLSPCWGLLLALNPAYLGIGEL